MQLYQKISNDNKKDYGRKVNNYIPLIISQYSNRTHFIFELLQNAEDAGASSISFTLYRDRLEMIHNGRLFNEADVVGVCGIADGTKNSTDGVQIGHFGIGFKSVYGYTTSPEIYSGKYHFRIENYLHPKEVVARNDFKETETLMIIPFNKESVSEKTAFKEIKEALTVKINSESLIMMNNIQDVYIDIDGYPEKIHINQSKNRYNSDNVYFMTLFTNRINKRTGKNISFDNSYLLFTDAEKEATAVIFKVDDRELIPIKNSMIYAFFPTAKESHQSFYIHAPFDTTPARDNFKEGDDFGRHNIYLINKVCELLRFAFVWLRDNDYLTFKGFSKVYPIYEYEKDDILYPIYKNSVDFISEGEPLLPTNQDGVYKSINNICVPANMSIVNVFNDIDLQRLTHKRDLYWLAKEISTNAYSDLKAFFDKNFQFKTYDWRDLVKNLYALFLKEKSISWMERLFINIESFCVRCIDSTSHTIDASEIPFVRLSDGDQICARQNGEVQVYINNPDVCKNKIDKDFLKNDIIRGFYERALRIPRYDIVEEVKRLLLKYKTRDVVFNTSDAIRENIEDLKKIKEALYANPSLIESVKDKYIVTDGAKWYLAKELYIRTDDIRSGYSLVKGIVDIRFLSEKYFEDLYISIDEDFLKKLGCSSGLREEPANKQVYLEDVKRFCGRDASETLRGNIFSKQYISTKTNWAFNYVGFPQVFKNMSVSRSLEIAKFLNRKTQEFDIQGEIVGANDKNFSGKSVDSAIAYTMLGLHLCYEKWIYTQGELDPHSPLEVERADILPEYESAKRLMDMLPFKKIKNAVTAWVESIYKNKAEQDLILDLLSDHSDLIDLAKAKAKSDAQKAAKAAKKEGIKDLINKADKKQKGDAHNTQQLTVSAISEKGLIKREENLERLFRESLDERIFAGPRLSFSVQRSNEAERVFLENEYDGICQICLSSITKYDNTKYFEAINMFKPSEMLDRYIGSIELGWNSLCLCPNCAAKYNYCSKKISNIYDQVMNTEIAVDSEEAIRIEIELPEGNQRSIHYSPRHFIALKKAFKFFAKDEG